MMEERWMLMKKLLNDPKHLEPVINFIHLESKKCSGIPLSLTIEAWEIRGKSVIQAM